MLEIKEITTDKNRFIHLLLIGDEQQSMIDRYIGQSRLFIGFISGVPSACCAVVDEGDNIMEIKNLAVLPEHRRKGIGRSMLEYAESLYPDKIFQLGTGETPSTLRFYHDCGYSLSHRLPDFFTDNYDHPIVEEGVRLKDMVYLRKSPHDMTGIHKPEDRPADTIVSRIKRWLTTLSYRTGMYVLGACVLFYVVSFAQMLLPISVGAKGTLWVIFFGLAKTAQYSALLILGKAGLASLRKKFRKRRIEEIDPDRENC